MAGRDVSEGPDPRLESSRGKMLHWLALAATAGILVLMVWKPGA
jgi:succinate dehydrogenase hydrophobic anchor subunit